jgi:hypothetical protein
MSHKQHENHKPQGKSSPIVDDVAAAVRMLDNLKAERVKLAERAAEYAESVKRLSYASHALHDAEATRDLSAARAEAFDVEHRLREHDHAIAEAERRLQQAQAALTRDERRAVIRQEQKRCGEFRQLGPFLDKSTDSLRRGLQALAANADAVGKNHFNILTLHRCLKIALFDTVFRDAFGAPDANDRRSFSSFSGVINQWCDSCDANLARELESLDGEQTEAA